MRLMASLAASRRPPRGLSGFGLGDSVSDLQKNLDAVNQQIVDANNYLAYINQQWAVNHFGGQTVDQFTGIVNAQNAKIAALQTQANALAGQINTLLSQSATSSAAAAAAPPVPPTAAQTAQALRETVAQQQSLVEVAMGPRYDFGRNSAKRTAFYRDAGLAADATKLIFDITSYLASQPQAGDNRAVPNWELTGSRLDLGGNMQRILDLDRPALGFDVLGAVTSGAKAGYERYRVEAKPAASAGGPSLSIPNPFAGVLPDWLAKAQIPKSVRYIGGGIIKSVGKAATAPNPNAIASTTVKTPAAARQPAGVSSWLLLGGAAVGGYVLWEALKKS